MIGELIGLYRRMNKLNVKQFGEVIGVSPATISRLESGKDCDMTTMLKLTNWLFTSPAPKPNSLAPVQPELPNLSDAGHSTEMRG